MCLVGYAEQSSNEKPEKVFYTLHNELLLQYDKTWQCGIKTVIYKSCVYDQSEAVTVSIQRWHWTAGNMRRTTVAHRNDVDRNSAVGGIGNRQCVTTAVLFQMIAPHKPLTADFALKTLLAFNNTTMKTNLYSMQGITVSNDIDWLMSYIPTQHKIGKFRDGLPIQSFRLVLKNYIKHDKSKHASIRKYSTT